MQAQPLATFDTSVALWFNTIVDLQPKGPEIDAVLMLLRDRFASITRRRFSRVVTALSYIDAEWSRLVLTTATAIARGDFRREFRYKWDGAQLGGRVSASSEFCSLLRQALTYGDSQPPL